MTHVCRKFNHAFEGTPAEGGVPITSPLYAFGPWVAPTSAVKDALYPVFRISVRPGGSGFQRGRGGRRRLTVTLQEQGLPGHAKAIPSVSKRRMSSRLMACWVSM